MTSAKLDPAPKSAATPSANPELVPLNPIEELDSAIETPPERTSAGPFQWNLK